MLLSDGVNESSLCDLPATVQQATFAHLSISDLKTLQLVNHCIRRNAEPLLWAKFTVPGVNRVKRFTQLFGSKILDQECNFECLAGPSKWAKELVITDIRSPITLPLLNWIGKNDRPGYGFHGIKSISVLRIPPTGLDSAFCEAIAALQVPVVFLYVAPAMDQMGYTYLPFGPLAKTETPFTFHYYPANGPVAMRGPLFHSHVTRLILSSPAISSGTVRLNTYVQSFTNLKVAEFKFIVNGTVEDLHMNLPPSVEILRLSLFDQEIIQRPLWVSGYGVTELTVFTTTMTTMSPASIFPLLEDLSIVLSRGAIISEKILNDAKTWILAYREKSRRFDTAQISCARPQEFTLALSCKRSTLKVVTGSTEYFSFATRCFLLPRTGFCSFMVARYHLGLLFHWYSEDLLYLSQRLYRSNSRLRVVQFEFQNNEREIIALSSTHPPFLHFGEWLSPNSAEIRISVAMNCMATPSPKCIRFARFDGPVPMNASLFPPINTPP